MVALSSGEKGNRAEIKIVGRLSELEGATPPHRIPNQDDPNHIDIAVTLKAPLVYFRVQAKWYSKSNLRLDTGHLRDWLLDRCQPTIPMWWDNDTGRVLWANPLSFLIETGGLKSRKTATFNADRHLQVLNSKSKASFVRWIRALCVFWPSMFLNSGLIVDDLEYPVSFAAVVDDPDILQYLPVSGGLIRLLRDYEGAQFAGRPAVPMGVLRAAQQGLRIPDKAARMLLSNYGVSEADREFLGRVRTLLEVWRDRIPANYRQTTAETLWAFDKLLSLVAYRKPGDLQLPPFCSDNTYPIGKLVGLLPSTLFRDPLISILEKESDHNVLQYAAWLVGISNHPVGSDIWRDVRNLRLSLQKKKTKIGKAWPLVDRQLLYCEAQLGGENAQHEYVHKLAQDEIGQFEAAYNHIYYQGNSDVISYRFERRLDEGLRTDIATHSILLLIYNHLRKWTARNNDRPLEILPHLWSS